MGQPCRPQAARSPAKLNPLPKPTHFGSHRLAASGRGGHRPRAASRRLPQRISKNALCQIDANGYDCHGHPLPANE